MSSALQPGLEMRATIDEEHVADGFCVVGQSAPSWL